MILLSSKRLISKLTAAVTLSDKVLNSDEDLFPSSEVKFCCILNSNSTIASDPEEAVVATVAAVVVVAAVVPKVGDEVSLTPGVSAEAVIMADEVVLDVGKVVSSAAEDEMLCGVVVLTADEVTPIDTVLLTSCVVVCCSIVVFVVILFSVVVFMPLEELVRSLRLVFGVGKDDVVGTGVDGTGVLRVGKEDVPIAWLVARFGTRLEETKVEVLIGEDMEEVDVVCLTAVVELFGEAVVDGKTVAGG